jgi:hypothetical protein
MNEAIVAGQHRCRAYGRFLERVSPVHADIVTMDDVIAVRTR